MPGGEGGGLRLELAPDREFVAWAFAEPGGYRSRPLAERMSGRIYLRPTGPGFDPSRLSSRGRVSVILDRAVMCGWRFVAGRGAPRTSWAVADDRQAAVEAARAYSGDMESYDRAAAPDYRAAADAAAPAGEPEARGPGM